MNVILKLKLKFELKSLFFWAATASCSWEEAAPATRVLVSSTRALAVFRMFSR